MKRQKQIRPDNEFSIHFREIKAQKLTKAILNACQGDITLSNAIQAVKNDPDFRAVCELAAFVRHASPRTWLLVIEKLEQEKLDRKM